MRRWTAAAAGLLAVALGVWPLSFATPIPHLVAAGALGVAAVIVALAACRWSFAGLGIVLLVLHYTASLIRYDAIDIFAPLFALGLLLMVELIDLAMLTARRGNIEPSVVLARARFGMIVAAVGTPAAVAALVAGAIVTGGNPLLLLMGALLGLTAVALTVSLARETIGEAG